jgi:N-acetylneuraminate synthase
MAHAVSLRGRLVGEGHPTYIIAEIGLNHNGDVNIAKQLIDIAAVFGCDAVKFQKRTPELCVPRDQWDVIRDTPWGRIPYIEYRHKVEFGVDEYRIIDAHCKEKGIHWFASCWDEPSVDFMEQFDPPVYKIASASLTDDRLLSKKASTGKPIILSTGMSTMDEIEHAVTLLPNDRLILLHTTSTYPCKAPEINLRMMQTLRERFRLPVGYSGHEVGLQISVAAAALGAVAIERHITLDRTMWGTDQAASVEPSGLQRLVRDVRVIEQALGDGQKRVYESELPIRAKLRKVG